jgi:TolB-like protein
MFKHFILLSSLFIFTACSSIIHKKATLLPTNKIYAIASFWNYTETPMAGLRAASIVESVLSQKNISLHSLIDGSDDVLLKEGKQKLFNLQKEQAKSMGANYLITGNVQEWQYKIGIDAEPVVSYTIKVIDLRDNAIVFNAVGAKSAWGHKSIGVVAQEIAKELIPQFID